MLGAEGPGPEDREDALLRGLTDLVHARRTAYREEHGLPPAPREDSEFVVRLTAAASIGEGIFGPFFDAMMGHEDDTDVERRFRAWLAKLLIEHLQS